MSQSKNNTTINTREKKMKLYQKALEGFESNPILATITPNELCPCGSTNKFKKCCKDKLSKYLTVEQANAARQELKSIGYIPPEFGFKK